MNRGVRSDSAEGFVKRFLGTEDGHFALDTIRNVFWFCVIALSALGLQSVVAWADSNGASHFIVVILTGVEYALLIADVIWFLSRLVVGTYVSVKNTFGEVRREPIPLTKGSNGRS